MGADSFSSKTLTILKWEYRQKVRSRPFVFSLFFIPLVLILFAWLPGQLISRQETMSIGVASEPLLNFLSRRNAEWNVVAIPPQLSEDEKRKWIEEGIVDAIAEPSGIWYARSQHAVEIELAVMRFLASSHRELRRVEIVRSGEVSADRFLASLMVAMAVLLAILQSAGSLLRGFIEERSTRVLEVLRASVKPLELMTSKVLALALVGLTQIAVWASVVWATGARKEMAALTAEEGIWVVIFFVTGYFFYAAVFGALGAWFTSEHDIQPVQSVLSILGIIPVALSVWVMESPDSTAVAVLSYVPFITPTLMAMRVMTSEVSVVECTFIALSLAAWSAVVMVVAAALFDRAARFQTKRRETAIDK